MSNEHHSLGGIVVPRGMIWIDEHDWLPVQKSKEYSVEGALLLDVSVKQAGRPITLQADDDAGWISLGVLNQICVLASDPVATHRLILADGREFDVQFDASDDAITARRIGRPALPPFDWDYVATFKLITV
ncbi:hypothetical protein HNP33_002554 [Comamonas odontotermitis]|uniref:Uncharacterized protein n=1 Tax=Comamonas odontotermitis TaxID=379895 RepID=A0ABR6RH31_9BURK|nr:hypothetical protein [Comamonas odontotermitis]MBB6578472.1 hypothetical protein [Comamonas odontotermitis]